jgi:hypothetical protein
VTQSIEQQASTTESRGTLVGMYSRGFISEAKTNFATIPGATDAAWQSFERMMTPIRAFVLDGTWQYPVYDMTTEYAGLPVPESEQASENPDPPETRSRGEYAPKPEPGHINAVEEQSARGTRAAEETRSGSSDGPSAPVPAAELIERARSAKTESELDEIESQANGRVTVEDAVADRREELAEKKKG